MIDDEFLYTVAQAGVTDAGFSTLVTVGVYRQQKRTLQARIYYMFPRIIILLHER